MNKKGFTLVELLAVIAILAILVIIALPNVLSMFNSAKKDTFLTEAKTIYKEIAKKYISETMRGNKITEINSDDDSKLDISASDIDYCAILDKNGGVEELVVANGTYYIQLDDVDNVNMITVDEVNEGTLDVLGCGALRYGKATTYIRKLYNDEAKRSENGLKKDNTKDKNIRYEGANPNNYVSFNGELWRIIGVFGDNVKLVRSKKIGELAWDSSADSLKNNGFGINEWSQADIKNYLNDRYYGGRDDIKCYDKYDITACPSGKLNDTAKNMINDHLWNTGGVDIECLEDEETWELHTVDFYEAERGNETGSVCYYDDYCDDEVDRTTTWKGHVGLPYVTDWAYASSEKVCETNLDDGYDIYNYSFENMTCKKNNWMHLVTTKEELAMWTISPTISYGNFTVMAVYYDGGIGDGIAYAPISIFPSIYLKSRVKIVGGTGTSSNPYELKL